MPWSHPDDYDIEMDLVQVLCRVLPDDPGDPPRAVNLAVSSGDHGVGDPFVSIGWRGDDGEWFVAGWNMAQDCWQDARCFKVVGFQPLAPIPELIEEETFPH